MTSIITQEKVNKMHKNQQRVVSKYEALLPTFKLELQLRHSNNSHQLCIIIVDRESGAIYDAQINDMKINIQSVGFFTNAQNAFDFITKNVSEKQLNKKKQNASVSVFHHSKNKGRGIFTNSNQSKVDHLQSETAQNIDIISLTEDGNLIVYIPNQNSTGKGVSYRMQMTLQTKQRAMSEVDKIISQNSLLRQELTITQKQNESTRKVLSQQNQTLKQLSQDFKHSTQNVQKLRRQIQQQNHQNDQLIKQIEQIEMESEQIDSKIIDLELELERKKKQLERLKTATDNIDSSEQQSSILNDNQQFDLSQDDKNECKVLINQEDFTPIVNTQIPTKNNIQIKSTVFSNLTPVAEQSRSNNDSYSKGKFQTNNEEDQFEDKQLSVHSSDSQFTKDIKYIHNKSKKKRNIVYKELRNSQSLKQISKIIQINQTGVDLLQQTQSENASPTFGILNQVPSKFEETAQKFNIYQNMKSASAQLDINENIKNANQDKIKTPKRFMKNNIMSFSGLNRGIGRRFDCNIDEIKFQKEDTKQDLLPQREVIKHTDSYFEAKSSESIIQSKAIMHVSQVYQPNKGMNCTSIKEIVKKQNKCSKTHVSSNNKKEQIIQSQQFSEQSGNQGLNSPIQLQKKLKHLQRQTSYTPDNSLGIHNSKHIKVRNQPFGSDNSSINESESNCDVEKGTMIFSSLRLKKHLSEIITEKKDQETGTYNPNQPKTIDGKLRSLASMAESQVLIGKFDQNSGFNAWLEYSDPFQQQNIQKQKQQIHQKIKSQSSQDNQTICKKSEIRVQSNSCKNAQEKKLQSKQSINSGKNLIQRMSKMPKQIAFLNKNNEVNHNRQGISFKFEKNILTKTGRAKYQQIIGSNCIPLQFFDFQNQPQRSCFFRVQILKTFNFQILFGIVTQTGSKFHSSCMSKQSIYYSCWDGCIWSQGKRISYNKPLGQIVDTQAILQKNQRQQYLNIELRMQIVKNNIIIANQTGIFYNLIWFVNSQKVGAYEIKNQFVSTKYYPKVQLSYLGDCVHIY